MDDKATKRGGGAVVVMALVAVLVVLPILYVLSIGPVVWLAQSGFISPSLGYPLEFVYSPLKWVADNVPIIGPAINGYVELWRPAPSAPIAPSAS